MFYVGCHRPTTTLILYPGLGQAVNGALAELTQVCVCVCVCIELIPYERFSRISVKIFMWAIRFDRDLVLFDLIYQIR